MNEEALIQDAQNGNLEAFNRLVLEYQNLAFNVAYRILYDAPAAEDATQDSFIKAYKKINQFRGGSFKAWMMRIVTNTCYDELRRKKRRPSVPLEPMNDMDEEIESPYWLIDPEESPEEASERFALHRAIQSCLGNLSDDFRAVVVLVDIQGMDYAEAADIVRTPLGTIKSRLARARKQMRDCLQGFVELLPSAFRLEHVS